MGRRRQRHFNPATAGCHAVVDARFGMVLTGYPYVSEVAARVGTTYKMFDALLSLSPQPYNINGQASVKFFESSMGLIDNMSNPPTFAAGQSMFICSSLDATPNGYQRMVSSASDVYFACGYLSQTPPLTSGIFSIAGNGTTWNDIDANSPLVTAGPYAMCIKRELDTKLTPTVNTTVQSQKVDSSSSYNADYVGRGPYPAVTQYWTGDIAMIAIGQTTGVPMDRRILQMMGRVWRIHTL
jgi:hypothetical protein